jgi:hypothetical protein
MKIINRNPHRSIVKKRICCDCGATLAYVPKDVVIRSYSCCGSIETDTFMSKLWSMAKCMNEIITTKTEYDAKKDNQKNS